MQLSKRLSAVASLITEGSRLADIGTDHGYVPIALVESGRIPSAVAMDVNKGPLERAQEHIREKHLEDRIKTRLSDGVKALEDGEADAVLIAGMGGMLVIRILDAGRIHWSSVKEWILQPQSDLDKVRRFLAEEGFEITAEDMIKEDGKYYPMMRVVYGQPYTCREKDYYFGGRLIKSKHPVLKEWLIREESKMASVIEGLSKQESDTARERKEELTAYRKLIQEVLAEYEM